MAGNCNELKAPAYYNDIARPQIYMH